VDEVRQARRQQLLECAALLHSCLTCAMRCSAWSPSLQLPVLSCDWHARRAAATGMHRCMRWRVAAPTGGLRTCSSTRRMSRRAALRAPLWRSGACMRSTRCS
jgi:hypothetical protein